MTDIPKAPKGDKMSAIKGIEPDVDMSDDGYMFKSTGTPLQDSISDAESKVLNKPAEKAERITELGLIEMIIHNYGEKDAAAKIFGIIDRQAKEITEWNKLKCGPGYNGDGLTCDTRHADIGHYITHYKRAKEVIDHQADEIKQYQKLYATMKEQVRRQAEHLKAKNTALDDIRVNAGRDTISTQWIKKRAEQGLEEREGIVDSQAEEIARIQDERIDELRESAELRANIKAIADAVRPYTSHKDDCHFMHDPPDHPEGRCTCGLEQALKGGD